MFNGLHSIPWNEDAAFHRPRPGNAPILEASFSLARLDERLKNAPDAVRAGWRARALIHEAAATARLDSVYVAAQDLTLMLSDTPDRTPDQDLGRTLDLHRMLEALKPAKSETPVQPATPDGAHPSAAPRPRAAALPARLAAKAARRSRDHPPGDP
jgi:hypothetical protein